MAAQNSVPAEALRFRARVEAVEFNPTHQCRCGMRFEGVDSAVEHVQELHSYFGVAAGERPTLLDVENAVEALIRRL